MTTRPATTDDIPAMANLSRRWDVAFFGAAEQSESEFAERVEGVPSLDTHTLLVLDGADLRGVALRGRTDTVALADPEYDPASVYALLLDWFAGGVPAHVEALSKDAPLLGVLAAKGWRHTVSAFELLRTVDDTLELPVPQWPAGVEMRGLRAEDAVALHHLIYVDAAWTDVPGHPHRDFADWRRIFIDEHTVPEQQVLAWRGDRLVGAAIGRTWDDGTGWVSQLAAAKDERGRGLGRALLAAALRLRREAGASALGLSVQAENRGALAMYLAAGLEIDREWLTFEPPADLGDFAG